MRWVLDALYLLLGLVSAPIWLCSMVATGKIRTDWPGRFGLGERLPDDPRPTVLFHAVSVGEVNAIRLLIDRLAARSDAPRLVIASTTNTGLARAQELYGQEHAVVRYPFDLSLAVSRFLNRISPTVVVLVELEVWPNSTAACTRRDIPVGVINGRLSKRSFDRYRRVLPFIRPSFARLAFAGVQTVAYQKRFSLLGTPSDRVSVTDTMKWDTAVVADRVDGADQLATEMGIDRSRPLVVAGSTAPDEHRLLHEAIGDGVQLLCAPRKPEWFARAATALPGCARRSTGDCGSRTDRFLLDTLGELRAAYALADLVIVGRTFGRYGGSDMMEPVSLGKATLVGPDVRHFQETTDRLIEADGLVQTDSDSLRGTVQSLLADPGRRARLAENGRGVIRQRQGASALHTELIMSQVRLAGPHTLA